MRWDTVLQHKKLSYLFSLPMTEEITNCALAHHSGSRHMDSEVFWVDPGEVQVYCYATVVALGGLESDPSNVDSVGCDACPAPEKVVSNAGKKPATFVLHSNYPNPFNPSSTITYSVPKDVHVTLKVYDVLGREVAILVDGFKEANWYEVTFDASKLSSGLFF